MVNILTKDTFKDLLAPFNFSKSLAVAVSGGADSFCLLYFLYEWAKEHHYSLTALSVDHKLRPDSSDEIEVVKKWCDERNTRHQTLVWDHQNPKTGLQKKARENRYQLMIDYCHENNIRTLFTAHHLDDQKETFLMRLRKGSGLRGLCCMQPKTFLKGISLIRPFLEISKKTLLQSATHYDLPYINDPSNENSDFERVQWRNVLKTLQEKNLDFDQLSLTLERLSLAQNFIDQTVQNFARENLKKEGSFYTFPLTKFQNLHKEIALGFLSHLLQHLNPGKNYPPRFQTLSGLYEKLNNHDFKGCTAGNAYFKKQKDQIIVSQEQRHP